MFPPTPGTRRGDQRERGRGRAAPPRTSRGTRPPPAARRPPTRSPRTSARPRRRRRRSRRPPPTTDDGHRAHHRQTYRFTVQAINPAGNGPASALSNAVTPLNPVVPDGADRRGRAPGRSGAQVELDGAASRWRQPDHRLHVTPYIGAAPRPGAGRRRGHAAHGHRSHERHDYTFRVTARNAVGIGPPPPPRTRSTPQNTIFDLATPRPPTARTPARVEVGVKFRADVNGSVTGVRFYKAAANTGTHVGSLWSSTGTRLAQATFSNESARAGRRATFSTPGGRHRRHDLRRVVLRAERPLLRLPRRARRRRSTTRRCTRWPNSDERRTASTPTAPPSTFPTNSFNSGDYWVDVMFALPAPGGHQRRPRPRPARRRRT